MLRAERGGGRVSRKDVDERGERGKDLHRRSKELEEQESPDEPARVGRRCGGRKGDGYWELGVRWVVRRNCGFYNKKIESV